MATLHHRVYDAFKRQAAYQIIPRLFENPTDRNMLRIAKAFEKIAITNISRQRAYKMRYLFERKDPSMRFMQRLAEKLNPLARRRWIENVYLEQIFLSKTKRQAFFDHWGFYPPHTIVISPLGRCNYHCAGCWASDYTRDDDMPLEVLDRLVGECRDMGIHWITFTGGEPFLRSDLFSIYEKYSDVYFSVFTNASLLSEEAADRLAQLGNVCPMISVEGWEAYTDQRRGKGAWKRNMEAMDRLRERGVPFGFSVTATRHNVKETHSREFVKFLVEKGAYYAWYFQYIPIGRDPDLSLMITPEQRMEMRHAFYRLRTEFPIYMVDFWNDGPETGGCLAGGRVYLHINPKGDVEPCVFTHLAADNINQKSLAEALGSPFFRRLRERIPYDGNELAPCMIIDRPEVLRSVYADKSLGIYPTHSGAEEHLFDPKTRAHLDEYGRRVREMTAVDWAEGNWQRMVPDPPEFDTIKRLEGRRLIERLKNPRYSETERVEDPFVERLSHFSLEEIQTLHQQDCSGSCRKKAGTEQVCACREQVHSAFDGSDPHSPFGSFSEE